MENFANVELIDTHSHLYLDAFKDDRDKVIAAALAQNVKKIFLPNIDSSTIDSMLRLSRAYPDCCFPLMGLHPCSVKTDYREQLTLVERYLFKSGQKFYGVGETGLDFYWDTTYKKEQLEVLSIQAAWAVELDLPIVLHTRESFQEVYDVVSQQMKGLENPGIFHCFTGEYSDARKAIDAGFKLGIGGVVTFKNSRLGDVLKKVSLEHIVLETDSPYLAPVPYRGRRNESAYITFVAERVAHIYGVTVETVAQITTQNAKKVFRC